MKFGFRLFGAPPKSGQDKNKANAVQKQSRIRGFSMLFFNELAECTCDVFRSTDGFILIPDSMERLIDIFARDGPTSSAHRASACPMIHLNLRRGTMCRTHPRELPCFPPAFELPVKFCRGETRSLRLR